MLQNIHEKLTGPFAITILGMLAVVFVFWGVQFVSVGSGPRATGLKVDGNDVSVEQVRRAYQEQLNRYQVALGDQDVPEDLKRRLQEQVLEGTIRSELIRQRADDLHLRASNEQLVRTLQEVPAFQVDGKFSKDAYYAALRSQNIEPAAFEADQRHQLAVRLLDRGIAASSFATPQEIDRLAQLRLEKRDLAYAVVPVGRFVGEINPDDAAIADYYARNGKQFMTPEQASLEYVELSLTDVAASVAVTEEALRGFYEENHDRFTSVERRRASHILVTIDKDEAAAEKRAKEILERAKHGEDFAALAKQYSQDTASAQQGGDLGWAEKSFFVGPFADAVWGMQVGEIRGPVRTEFGWHIIRLDGVEGGKVKSFEEARAEIEPDFRRSQAEKLFGDLQEKLDTAAFESGGKLQQVAAELALPLKQVEAFTREGGGDLGKNPKLVAAVFDPAMTAGTTARTVELGEGRVVAVRVASYRKAEPRPLADVREQVVAAVKQAQARARAAAAASDLMKQLQGGGDWTTLAAAWTATLPSGPSTTSREVGRDDTTFAAEVVKAAFKAPRPGGTTPIYGVAALASGDTAVWKLAAVRAGSSRALDSATQTQFVSRALDESRGRDASTYLASLRHRAKVQTNPKLFE